MGEIQAKRKERRKKNKWIHTFSQSAEKHGVREMRRNGITDECEAKSRGKKTMKDLYLDIYK